MSTVTFEQKIKPYFSACYRTHMQFYCDLWSKADCETNWQDIFDSVANESMPQPGCPEGVWDSHARQQFLSDFTAWKAGGFL
jgi:hypothetical protein